MGFGVFGFWGFGLDMLWDFMLVRLGLFWGLFVVGFTLLGFLILL